MNKYVFHLLVSAREDVKLQWGSLLVTVGLHSFTKPCKTVIKQMHKSSLDSYTLPPSPFCFLKYLHTLFKIIMFCTKYYKIYGNRGQVTVSILSNLPQRKLLGLKAPRTVIISVIQKVDCWLLAMFPMCSPSDDQVCTSCSGQ